MANTPLIRAPVTTLLTTLPPRHQRAVQRRRRNLAWRLPLISWSLAAWFALWAFLALFAQVGFPWVLIEWLILPVAIPHWLAYARAKRYQPDYAAIAALEAELFPPAPPAAGAPPPLRQASVVVAYATRGGMASYCVPAWVADWTQSVVPAAERPAFLAAYIWHQNHYTLRQKAITTLNELLWLRAYLLADAAVRRGDAIPDNLAPWREYARLFSVDADHRYDPLDYVS